MDREILNQLYLSNKADIINKEWLITTIEKLQETLQNAENNKVSDFLYKMLCEYFIVDDNNIQLTDIISDATASNKYKTLEELENKINEIRKGE